MALIGSWGDIVFSVSREEIKTFDGLKWDSGASYATHQRHLKEPLLEFKPGTLIPVLEVNIDGDDS